MYYTKVAPPPPPPPPPRPLWTRSTFLSDLLWTPFTLLPLYQSELESPRTRDDR